MSIRRISPVPACLLALMVLFVSQSVAQNRVTLTWQVQKYDLKVTMPQNPDSQRDLDVTAELTLKNVTSSAFSRATLRISDQATIKSVTANGATADFASAKEAAVAGRALQRIATRIPSVGPGQTVTLRVNYSFNVRANDGLASLSSSGFQLLPSAFWYPTPTSWYFTGGGDFAPFKVSIEGPSRISVVTAGGPEGVAIAGQPFVVAGEYQSVKSGGIEVFYIRNTTGAVRSGRTDEIVRVATEANSFISERLGKELGAPIKLVFVRRGAGFADSGTILLDDSVLVREKVDSDAVRSIAEGLAKSYLGNVITVNGDGYGVIREGLARHLSNLFIESEYGGEVAEIEKLQQRTNYAAIAERDAPLNIVTPADGYFYTSSANKGSMIWSYLGRSYGAEFFNILKSQAADGNLNLVDLRSAFSREKAYLDYTIDQVTDMNLMIGIPQKANGRLTAALRNFGQIPATVTVTATTSSGQKLDKQLTLPPREFGQAVFNTSEDVVRVEVDTQKAYPQTNFSDDIAPRISGDADPLLFVKREFDRQRFAEAQKNAEAVLSVYPNLHDVRILLARSQLGSGNPTGAKANFERVLSAALPSPQNIAWAEFGLGEIAKGSGQNAEAAERYRKAISGDADYGATLGAVRGLIGTPGSGEVPADVRQFFAEFDKAVISNSKAQVEAIILGGEVSRFAASVVGQAQQWATDLKFTNQINDVEVLVATEVELKLLNREIESGVAVFRLTKVGSGWKLSGAEIFEVG